jgi:hypothetical protein
MNSVETNSMLQTLGKVWELCPEMRLGQLMATLGLLAEDTTDHSLWDVEDRDLLAVMERFQQDLSCRDQDNDGRASN